MTLPFTIQTGSATKTKLVDCSRCYRCLVPQPCIHLQLCGTGPGAIINFLPQELTSASLWGVLSLRAFLRGHSSLGSTGDSECPWGQMKVSGEEAPHPWAPVGQLRNMYFVVPHRDLGGSESWLLIVCPGTPFVSVLPSLCHLQLPCTGFSGSSPNICPSKDSFRLYLGVSHTKPGENPWIKSLVPSSQSKTSRNVPQELSKDDEWPFGSTLLCPYGAHFIQRYRNKASQKPMEFFMLPYRMHCSCKQGKSSATSAINHFCQ